MIFVRVKWVVRVVNTVVEIVLLGRLCCAIQSVDVQFLLYPYVCVT